MTGTTLAQTTVGDTDYTVREITIAPGGSTGWHYHDGVLFAMVRRGVLNHYDSGCDLDGTYSAGAVFAESPGVGQVHIGRNLETEPLVLDVLYVLPIGSPLSEDAPDPGCPRP